MAEESPRKNHGAQRTSEIGDAGALTALDARYRAPLASYFLKRVRADEDVDDLVQEVFLRLAVRANLGDVDQVSGYIFATAANVLRDRLRRRASHRVDAHDEYVEDDAAPQDNFSPERVLLGKAALQEALDAIEELPAMTRMIFLLRRFDGLSHAAIAERVRLSQSGVRKHIVRALAYIVERTGREA